MPAQAFSVGCAAEHAHTHLFLRAGVQKRNETGAWHVSLVSPPNIRQRPPCSAANAPDPTTAGMLAVPARPAWLTNRKTRWT